MEVTEKEALLAYARMLNTGDLSHLEPLLPEDFHYGSQWVLPDIPSKDAFLTYMSGKLATIASSDTPVFAEMGYLPNYAGGRLCVVLAQGERENRVATVLAKVRDGVLLRLDLCNAPSPRQAQCSGEYPQ